MAKGMGVTPFDVVLIVSLLACAGILWMAGMIRSAEPSVVSIYTEKGPCRQVRLGEDARIRVQGPLGESVVQVRFGEVFMVSSPCPDRVCVHTGRISRPGEGILCIPNRISVTIGPEDDQADAVTY